LSSKACGSCLTGNAHKLTEMSIAWVTKVNLSCMMQSQAWGCNNACMLQVQLDS